ncbi:MAG: S-layer homology domain-containing protein [Clostridia bacterium]|nr:S-layer homology domain-containing protein [Clostridia bacterium]
MKKFAITLLTLALILVSFGQLSAFNISEKFTDMGNHWADTVVGKLTEVGAIGGYADGTFKPDNPITRAEFSKILTVSLGLEKIEGSAFNDTATHWAKNDINTLVHHGIIDKSEYGSKYEPDKNITRVEIAKMVVRASGFDKEAREKAGQNTGFKDNSSIKSSDRGYVIIAKENKLVGGYPDNTFKPNNNATRAEASAMIVRTLEFIQDGPKEKVEIPRVNGVVITDKLPKKTFEEAGLEEVRKKASSTHPVDPNISYTPNKIIELNQNLFPFEYEKLVIRDFKYIPYEETFLAKTEGPIWGSGRPLDLLVFDGVATEEIDMSNFILFMLDEKNDIIHRYINIRYVDRGRENSPSEQAALKEYPYMLVQDDDYRILREGRVTLIFVSPSENSEKAKSVLLCSRDSSKQTTDIIKLPIN